MLYREVIAVCSEIHTEHINTACGAERGIVECYRIKNIQEDCNKENILIIFFFTKLNRLYITYIQITVANLQLVN